MLKLRKKLQSLKSNLQENLNSIKDKREGITQYTAEASPCAKDIQILDFSNQSK